VLYPLILIPLLTQFVRSQHGGGVRCKLEGCNRVAIGKLQLCRAHGGGARPRRNHNRSPLEDDEMEEFENDVQGFVDMASV
jgi:hypothetical protein